MFDGQSLKGRDGNTTIWHEENGAIVAWRGQMVRAEEGKKPRLLAMLGDPEALGGYVRSTNGISFTSSPVATR